MARCDPLLMTEVARWARPLSGQMYPMNSQRCEHGCGARSHSRPKNRMAVFRCHPIEFILPQQNPWESTEASDEANHGTAYPSQNPVGRLIRTSQSLELAPERSSKKKPGRGSTAWGLGRFRRFLRSPVRSSDGPQTAGLFDKHRELKRFQSRSKAPGRPQLHILATNLSA
jgi:hypothetical protein